jgi:capsular exopolysaccharide synthesis family protein
MRDQQQNDDAFDTESMRGGTLFEYLEILRRRWLVVVIAVLVVTIAGVVFAKSQRKMYASSSSLAVSTTSMSSGGGMAAGGGAGADLLSNIESLSQGRNVETQTAILSSPDLLAAAISHLSEKERLDGFGIDKSMPLSVPKWAFDVEQKKNVDVITVDVTSFKPKLAAKLADEIVQTYLNQDLERNQQQAKKGADYVWEEMRNIHQKLVDSSKELAEYSKKSHMIVPEVEVTEKTRDLLLAELELDRTRVAARAEKFEVQTLAREISKLSPEIPLSTQIQRNPDVEQARERISALQGKLYAQQQLSTPDSPEIKVIKQNLATEQKNIQQFSKDYVYARTVSRNPALDRVVELYAQALGQSVTDEEKEKGIEQYVNKRKAEFETIPEHGREYAELKETVDTLLRTYDLLSQKYYTLLIEEKSSIPNGFVVSKAPTPLKPSFPNMTTAAALSLFLGILAGVLAAMILERLDTRIHDPALVERITGLTVLTAVPEVKATTETTGRSLTIGSSDAPSGFAESFRLLRNNIAFSSPDQKLRIVAVTSAGKGDGKSTTSVNLAIAMAMDGNRVLLVDADLRRPALHKYLSLSREVGFTNVVRGNVTLEDAILPTAFDNVSCLTTGPLPPSPSEFLNSTQARSLFERASLLYDFVLVDCPPCTGLSDIQVISTLVQGIVLVVALDVTEKQYLAGAIRLLRLAGAPVLGMVLNRVRYSRSNYYYYSYYYYYGYYGEDELEDKKNKRGRKPPTP